MRSIALTGGGSIEHPTRPRAACHRAALRADPLARPPSPQAGRDKQIYGTLKALGVASLKPRSELPGISPIAATPGLEGYEVWPWQGIVVPTGTPAAIVAKLNATYVAAVNDPVVRQKIIDAGAELLQSTPQDMSDYMRKETAKWAEVVKKANIQID